MDPGQLASARCGLDGLRRRRGRLELLEGVVELLGLRKLNRLPVRSLSNTVRRFSLLSVDLAED